jgi:hypothetical protein
MFISYTSEPHEVEPRAQNTNQYYNSYVFLNANDMSEYKFWDYFLSKYLSNPGNIYSLLYI